MPSTALKRRIVSRLPDGKFVELLAMHVATGNRTSYDSLLPFASTDALQLVLRRVGRDAASIPLLDETPRIIDGRSAAI